jgi:hypothetical protein
MSENQINEGKAIEPSSQLLPCPFCGCTEILEYEIEGLYKRVQCRECGGGHQRAGFSPVHEWNTRSQPSTPTEGLCVVCRRTESDHRPDDHAFYRRPSTPTEVKLCECGCDRLEHPNGLGCRFDHFLACKVYRPKGDK